MELWLVGRNPEMVKAWKREFEGCDDVYTEHGDILEKADNTIVSPANGYGYMDGGIDRPNTEYFGLRPQQEIQKQIQLRPEGYLPVGATVLVKTGHEKIPYMISAPAMISPGPVRSCNAFFCHFTPSGNKIRGFS